MKKKSKKKVGVFFLVILSIGLIFSAYQFLLRPILKKVMATEVISIIIAFIILAALVITLLITLTLILYLIILKAQEVKNTRRWKHYRRKSISVLIIFLIILSGFTYYSQKNVYTKPLCNEYNDIIPTSVASLEKVKLNDNEEWISVRGKDKSKPILLVLSDGPGKSQMSSFNKSLETLEDDFVVVNWDELGTGKSYKSVDELTVDTYVSDGIELTKYLCKKYNKDKIYILGNSFGSTLGISMIKNNPDLYAGFIGVSSIISVKRNEEYRYNKALEIAEKKDEEDILRKLKAQGKPPYDKNEYKKQKVYHDYLKAKENENNKIEGEGENSFRNIFSSEYGLLDKVRIVTKEKETYDKIFKSYYDMDLINEVKEVKVPVYFFQGSYDDLASPDILNEYFSILNAPDKQIIWFEKSGSMPWLSENDEFVKNINKKFLNN